MSYLPTGEARTIVITGGNSGLGYGCAAALLSSVDGRWHIVVASRNAGRTQTAADKLAAGAAAGHTVEAMTLDLASLASVRTFAAELIDRVGSGEIPPLHALVCNAGVQTGTTLTRTADGFESTFGVNHLGHFLLVNEVLPLLQAPSRVVVVSSDTHDPALKLGPAPAWSNAQALARGELGPSAASDNAFVAGQRRYSTSKLANVYFTYGLARRLPAGVTANAFNPGMLLGTGLGRSLPAPVRFIAKHVLPHAQPLLRRFVTNNIHTAEESGAALAWLATDSKLADTTGTYFDGRRAIRSSDDSYDPARADDLWEDSLTLTAQPGSRITPPCGTGTPAW
jgi:NAD(P)-dependent dehydrogenase (short-subunit alcohol dehydrogenase family)